MRFLRFSPGAFQGISSTPFWVVAGFFIPIVGGPGEALAQSAAVGTGCDVPRFERFENVALSNGSRITYFSHPTIVCSGDTRITADSAVVYEATNYTQFFRNVVFQDADSRLTASQAHYFDQERRLRAWGNVVLTDQTEGSIIRGDTVVMLRAGPGRPEDQIDVLGRRPRATLYPTRQPVVEEAPEEPGEDAPETDRPPQDATGAEPDSSVLSPPDSATVEPDSLALARPDSAGVEDPGAPALPARREAPSPPAAPAERIPYEIEARRIFLEGSEYFRATGEVTIVRDSVNAAADSVEYDQALGALFLAQNSHLTTSNFHLSADRIRLDIPQDEIREVLARNHSVLEGDELKLLAPTINLFLTEGRLQRLVAIGDSLLDALPEEALQARPPHPAGQSLGLVQFPLRPHAFAQDFLLWADSIEVLAPEEVLEEVWAMGDARGESLAEDTLTGGETPEIARRDWLAGDTVIAVFLPDTLDSGVAEEAEVEMEVAPPPAGGLIQREEAQADSSRYRLDHLIARVGARSLYRMAASDSTNAEGEEDRLAIHYVVGEEITIHMIEGEVDHMEVTGATQGIHLEPVGPTERRGGGERGNALPPPPPVVPDTSAFLPGRGGR